MFPRCVDLAIMAFKFTGFFVVAVGPCSVVLGVVVEVVAGVAGVDVASVTGFGVEVAVVLDDEVVAELKVTTEDDTLVTGFCTLCRVCSVENDET